MSLLFFDSLQDCLLMPKPEWAPSVVWGGSQTGRDGLANSAAGGNSPNKILNLSSAAAVCIAGTAIKSAYVSVTDTILAFCTAGAVQQLTLRWNSSGFLEARKGTTAGTLLATSSGHAPWPSFTWAQVQMKADLHLTTGSVVVRLNDVQVLSVSGVSTSTVTGPVTQILMGSTGQNFSYWDDIYVCDAVDATATQGRPNNDFLGDLRVAVLYPSAAGDTTTWTASTGANWDTANEVPPNTTDYVLSATSGARDLYQMTDLPGVVNTVYALRTGYYATKNDAGASLLKPVIKENSVATVDTGQAVAYGSYVPIYGTQLYVRPSDSTLWTTAGLNALQVGMEVG